MNKQNIFLFFILLLLFGCKKKQEVKYYPIPDALKTACLFQKDSYWIYRNDSTGAVDCTYIYTNPVSSNTTDYSDNIVDYIQIPLSSSLISQFYFSGEFFSSVMRSDGYPFLADMKKYNYCCQGKTAFVLFDDTLSNHRGVQGCTCSDNEYPAYDVDRYIQMGIYSSLKVNNILFQKVSLTRSMFQNLGNLGYSKKDTIDFYFSPGVGLVKFIFKVDTSNSSVVKRATISWSLLRYHVIR